MTKIRWWFCFGLSVLVIMVGFGMGFMFMKHTYNVFEVAIVNAGVDPLIMVKNLAMAVRGILAWIVFGITMTNALIITSSLSVVMMVTGKPKEQ